MSKALLDIIETKSFLETIKIIRHGLKCPKDSGEYKYAKFALVRIFGPSTISIGISVLIALIMITMIVGTKFASDGEIEVTVMEPETVKLDEIQIEEIKPEEIQEQMVDTPVVTPGPPAEYSAPSETPGVGVDGDQDTPMVPLAPIMTRSPLVFKNLYGNRTKGGRNEALRAYGGNKSTEDAVLRALRWLKDHQNENGSWSGPDITAMTGFALLAFLAHGETPNGNEFGPTVEKAIKYLISVQKSDGSFSGNTYIHGIATYAMSESYALTKIIQVKDAMERSIQIIIVGQEEKGGFDYSYGNSDRWDMSCTGWQFQALKAAKMAGCTNPDLEKAIKKSIGFLKEGAFSGSGWGYAGSQKKAGGGTTWTMTGAGTLCAQMLGLGNSSQVKAGLKTLETVVFAWPKDNGKASVYGWYYVTQAKFQGGGSIWETWNKQFSRELVINQKTDGHWEGGDYDNGTHVYTTALCTLMLEVYYRYLPSYKKVEDVEEIQVTKGNNNDEIVVGIL